MADLFSRRKRSHIMSRVRGTRNERTEMRFVRLMREHGITGWRRHVMIRFPDKQGDVQKANGGASRFRPWVRPDFVFREVRLAVFVDGCFWHGCPAHGVEPRSNRQFWAAKIARNRERDRKNDHALRAQGWTPLHFWEHSLSGRGLTQVARRLQRALAR